MLSTFQLIQKSGIKSLTPLKDKKVYSVYSTANGRMTELKEIQEKINELYNNDVLKILKSFTQE